MCNSYSIQRGSCARNRASGFTFLELIIVMALLGIMFTMGAIKLGSSIPKYRLRTAARQLGSNIERMRLAAVNRGALCGIRYHFDEREPSRPETTGQGYSLLLSGGDYSDLNSDSIVQGYQGIEFMVLDRVYFHKSYHGVELLSIEMRGTQRTFSSGEPDVYFAPTGNTGSHIAKLATADGRRYTLIYNALTGAVDFHNTEQAGFDDFED